MTPHRVLIAGGGVAALEAAVALRALGGDELDIMALSPNDSFAFPAHQVREPFGGPAPLALPIAEILEGIGRHETGVVRQVDPSASTVRTWDGRSLPYDSLLLCVGGTAFPAYVHGITFDRPGNPEAFDALLDDIGEQLVDDVTFVVPDAAGWTLPAYDLALLLRGWATRSQRKLGIRVVTPERTPLESFGAGASNEVARVLARHDIAVVAEVEPVLISDTALVAGGHWMSADRIVSIPRLAGPRIPGIPCDWQGFVEVGPAGRVPGLPGVFAVGDGAAHRRKQGGLAAQQADEAARALLRDLGHQVPDSPDPPMLRGVLATPDGPLFLQGPLGYGVPGYDSVASLTPLWDPPSKVVTRWLGPYLQDLVARRTAAFSA